MKAIIGLMLFLCVFANAEETKTMTLGKHFDNDAKLSQKAGFDHRTNEYRGYLVSIEAVSLYSKSDSVFVYATNVSLGNGMILVGLKKTPEFSLEFDSAVAMEKEMQVYNQRLAQEGGGVQNYIGRKLQVRMWVLAKPAEFSSYVQDSGQISNAFAFDVVKVCKRDFKKCRSIKSEAEDKGIFGNFFK